MNCDLCKWPLDKYATGYRQHKESACLANMICDRSDYLRVIGLQKLVVDAARDVIGKNVTRPTVFEGRDTAKFRLAMALNALDMAKVKA